VSDKTKRDKEREGEREGGTEQEAGLRAAALALHVLNGGAMWDLKG